jgi:hypothetical protein
MSKGETNTVCPSKQGDGDGAEVHFQPIDQKVTDLLSVLPQTAKSEGIARTELLPDTKRKLTKESPGQHKYTAIRWRSSVRALHQIQLAAPALEQWLSDSAGEVRNASNLAIAASEATQFMLY